MRPLSLDAGEKKPTAVGPWGSQVGFRWDDGLYSTVRHVVIAHGAGIDSIQIEYDMKGTSIWSEKHGGAGGDRTDKVKLDYPDEFLTSLHGHYGKISEWSPVVIRSLTFESNRRTYGPFGVEQGTYFSSPMAGDKIVGFHGRSGWYLDAIGIYLQPLQQQMTSKALVETRSYIGNGSDSVGYSVRQGNVGNGYDIVVAVRQKDDFGGPLPSKLSTQISQEYSDPESNGKAISNEKVPSKAQGFVTFGPWGGTGGLLFNDGIYSGIRQIHLSRSIGIVSFKVQYDRAGQSVWGSKHGGTGGFKTDKIIFDYPYEILTHITGTYWPLMYMGPNIIKSLTFYTNKGRHGPFGEEKGPSFTTKKNEGKVVGFHGREGIFLDAIGVYVTEGKLKPVKHYLSNTITRTEAEVAEIDNSPWSNKLVVAKRGQTEEVACGVVKEPAPCGPGPWGGDGGRPWDDGVFTGIKQIMVTRSADAICSIQIEYDRNGQSVWSAKHGGSGGTAMHRVKLEYPHEVLVCLSGYYGQINGDERPKVVRSLTFYSSRGKYGPFGEEIGTFFTSTTTEGKLVGLHGRSGAYLDAIGVHMQHWLGNTRASKPSFFKFFSLSV
uniref:Pentatricopeptide repeat-containing protein n=2 Tax=Rhizophora mucronata TaxID=61149 RepID=A0A2P2IXV7_RHIMU